MLLGGFCAACRDAGLPLDRSLALIDTLHPVHEGRAFRWDSQQVVETEFEYGPSSSETRWKIGNAQLSMICRQERILKSDVVSD